MTSIFLNLFAPPRHMILLVIAAWIGLTLAEKRTERHGIGREILNNLIFYGLLAFILGGRISFVVQHSSAFSRCRLCLFSVNAEPGILFLTYTALTSGTIVFLAAFRGDQTLILNGIKQEQLLALAMLAISFILFEHRFNQLQKN
jgi:prolipoprotein diacylglyceryltransferase